MYVLLHRINTFLTKLISSPRIVIVESSANNDVFPVVFSNEKSFFLIKKVRGQE